MDTTRSAVAAFERAGGDPRLSTLQRYARAVETQLLPVDYQARFGADCGILGSQQRATPQDAASVIAPVEVAEVIERPEDAEDVAAARQALARVDAGDEPIALADLRTELGL